MRRITHTLVALAAASALAASTAAAQPVNDRVDRYDSPTSSLAGTVEHQDLRGEHAQDAARLAAQAVVDRGEQTRHTYFLRRQAPAGTATVKQDLRGEHARDAALGLAPGTVSGKPPVYWSYAYEAPKPDVATVSAPAPKPSDDTDLWLILGIALGATGIVAGSALAVSHRSRARVPA